MTQSQPAAIPLPKHICRELVNRPTRHHLSIATANELQRRLPILTMCDLLLYTEAELDKLRGIGPRRLPEIIETLASLNLRLPTAAELDDGEFLSWQRFAYHRDRTPPRYSGARLMLSSLPWIRMDQLCYRLNNDVLANQLRPWGVERAYDLQQLPRQRLPQRLAQQIDRFLEFSSLELYLSGPPA